MRIGATRLVLHLGSITQMELDAIVNAANSSLLGGGGVDGAIHRAAGPDLLAECRTLGGCRPGDAKITGGHLLPARHIIHTVGPVWQDGALGEADTLRKCYRSSLDVALSNGVRTIAFPAISTGIFGFPKDLAARIAVETCADFARNHPGRFDTIYFVCLSEEMIETYVEQWPELAS